MQTLCNTDLRPQPSPGRCTPKHSWWKKRRGKVIKNPKNCMQQGKNTEKRRQKRLKSQKEAVALPLHPRCHKLCAEGPLIEGLTLAERLGLLKTLCTEIRRKGNWSFQPQKRVVLQEMLPGSYQLQSPSWGCGQLGVPGACPALSREEQTCAQVIFAGACN